MLRPQARSLLKNVVVIDSVLKHLNKVAIQGFHGLRNVIELEDRQFYYFYNENCAQTAVDEHSLQGLGLDCKLRHKACTVLKYYHQHVAQITSTNKVYLLVQNKSLYKELLPAELFGSVIDVNDYVMRYSG